MSGVKLMAVLLSLCMLLTACQTKQTGTKDSSKDLISPDQIVPSDNKVTTGVAKKLIYEDAGKQTASVEYVKTEYLKWKYENSRVVEVHVTEGQQVTYGQTLITFENPIDTIELESLKLQLSNKQQEVDQERQRQLDAINQAKAALEGLSGYEQQLAQLKIDQKQVIYDRYVYETDLEIGVIQGKITKLEETVADNKLVAPYNGVISYINVNLTPGYTVNSKTELFTIRDSDKTYLYAPNSSAKVNGVTTYTFRYNQTVTVGGHEGKVIVSSEILPHKNMGTNSVLVELIDGSEESDQKGALMSYTIHEIYDVLLVGNKAVEHGYDDDGNPVGPYVVKVLEDGVIRKRQVSVGFKNSEGYIIILEGLSEDQVVVYND